MSILCPFAKPKMKKVFILINKEFKKYYKNNKLNKKFWLQSQNKYYINVKITLT